MRHRAAGPSGRRRRSALPVALAVSAAAVALVGCAGQEQSGDPAQQVATWVDQGGGGSSVGNLEVDVRNVDLALSRHNTAPAIREVCDLLANDAQTGVGDLPTPDQELTDDLNNAYTVATSAGNDCYHGAAGDARLLSRSAAERVRTLSLLQVAVARMTTVMGRTPTTDTTVPPQGGGDPFAGGT